MEESTTINTNANCDTTMIIEYAGGYEAARISRNSNGTATLEFCSPEDENGKMDWRNAKMVNKVFATPREAVLYVLENHCQW